MLSDEEKKKAEEMALGVFPDFKREDGNTVYCGALRHNFVVGYDAGYNEATKKIREELNNLIRKF